MKIIILSGTPGTGKTSVSNKISKIINAKLLSLNEIAISEKFTVGYDEERDTYIINNKKLVRYIKNQIKEVKKENYEFLIIESHFSDIIPNKLIDYAIVLRCDPDVLFDRLKTRGYKSKKINENIQAEILGECSNYLIHKKLKKPLLEIDTTNLNIDHVGNIIINIISRDEGIEEYKLGKIDWLDKLYHKDSLGKKYFYDL
jgi:adenylate kinase